MPISHEELKRRLHYNPLTGVWAWRVRHGSNAGAGSRAGCLHHTGYWIISLHFAGARRQYRLHRLAWFYMTGEWPKHFVDHKNTNHADDRWINLREATDSQNNANTRLRKTNTSGLKGVHWCKVKRKWRSNLKLNNKSIFLVYSDCPAVAHFAWVIASDTHRGEFARAR